MTHNRFFTKTTKTLGTKIGLNPRSVCVCVCVSVSVPACGQVGDGLLRYPKLSSVLAKRFVVIPISEATSMRFPGVPTERQAPMKWGEYSVYTCVRAAAWRVTHTDDLRHDRTFPPGALPNTSGEFFHGPDTF